MKHYKLLSAIAGFCLLTCAAVTTYAQQINPTDVPRTVSYQGILTSTDGTPLSNGSHLITVTLYADPQGTQALWQDSYRAETVNGIFNLYLGGGKALPEPGQMNRPLWVGTSVDGEKEMSPLTPLTSSPYALNLPDNTVTTGKLADGAVTAKKVNMDYISGITVNGEKISGNGAVLDIRSSDDIALSYDRLNNALNIGSNRATGTVDPEKTGATVQATNNDVWTMQGNGRTLAAGFPAIIPAPGDWIGTTNQVNFTIKINNAGLASGGNRRVMEYQQNGTSANILGGHNSNIIGPNSVGDIIAGGGRAGNPNKIEDSADFGVVGGGEANRIEYRSDWGAIGGGLGHVIDTLAHYATISGGLDNIIYSNTYSANSGGTIGGGGFNTVRGYFATVSGGQSNEANGNFSFVGGGGYEAIQSGGINGNVVDGHHSAIVGGQANYISYYSDWSGITAGLNDSILQSGWAIIGGGSYNLIDTLSNWSIIVGGDSNIIHGQLGFIGGGHQNLIEEFNGTIGGGRGNAVLGHTGTIAGGFLNLLEGAESFIGGGIQNTIDVGAEKSTIAGGAWNTIDPSITESAIGGGSSNLIRSIITVPVTHVTIPGGDNLIAQSWAQTVIGGFNSPKGSISSRSTSGDWNEPIFIIGNGVSSNARSNAFEVSYDGHSIVFDENGTGGWAGPGRGAVQGGTYTDNVIYGWAEVTATGEVYNACGDFGVLLITHPTTGVYQVKLNPVGPDGSTHYVIDCGAAVATLSSGADPGGDPVFPCQAFISTSALKDNVFDVYISQFSEHDCKPADLPFKFHVTGRPHP